MWHHIFWSCFQHPFIGTHWCFLSFLFCCHKWIRSVGRERLMCRKWGHLRTFDYCPLYSSHKRQEKVTRSILVSFLHHLKIIVLSDTNFCCENIPELVFSTKMFTAVSLFPVICQARSAWGCTLISLLPCIPTQHTVVYCILTPFSHKQH